MKTAKMNVPVTKMHGTQNDFVVLDLRAEHVSDLPAFGRWVCNRHAGVGADGLIVLENSAIADVRMRVINADGSEAEMCGNGVRCAARWLDEARVGADLRFETLAGIVETHVVAREPEYRVRVSMGVPKFAEMPVRLPGEVRYVDLGNPHVVLVLKNVDDVELTMVANRLQGADCFPNGTNVHVAAVEGNSLRVRHWERGVGLTMSCGTGALACAATAIDAHLLASPVDVVVPGGRLVVEWDGVAGASLTGPAVRVFDTEVRVEDGIAP
jgi:diaminopimelate epimerase